MAMDVLTGKAAVARKRMEIPILVAALAVVPVILIEEQATSTAWLGVANWANWVIWGLFFAEYVAVMALTDQRWSYTKRAWLDVFIIVVSFPILPAVLASTRLLRLARLTRVLRVLRLARLAAVVSRGGMATRAIFKTRGLGYILVLTLLLSLGIGGVFALLEGSQLVDGMWWAIVTVTTVGYGDMFPVTPWGRAAATILMLLGIGFVAVITASVAAYFVESTPESDDLAEEVRRVHERLDNIERLIATQPPEPQTALTDEEHRSD
jgi:voltage-gated potassium channel